MGQLTPERIAEVQSEHGQQTALFAWAALPETRAQCPGIECMFAIPNGGERNLKVAANLKAEGVRAGVADVFLPVPVQYLASQGTPLEECYHGLWIEMKFGTNKPTPEQIAFLASMQAAGYATAVCYSFADAKQTILSYYNRPVVVI